MFAEHEVMHVWWLWAVTFAASGYIVAAETLSDVAGWSRLGIGFATLLLVLLALGRLVGISRINSVGWIWIPCAFLGYTILRSFLGTRYTNFWDVLSAMVSAYLGGIGVAMALQAGIRFKALVYAQIVASLCQIAAGFYGLGTELLPGETEARYSGLTGNANELGLQLTLGACMIWLLPKKAGMFGCLFAFVFAGYAIVTTGSRQALLAGLFFVVLVLIQAWSVIQRRRFFFSVMLGALCVVGLFLIPVLIDRGRDITAVQRALEYDSDSSYHKRVTMMRQGLRLWMQTPVLGNGLNAFQDLSGQGVYAHNDYVELLCDLGLFGVLLFYAIHASILVRSFRLPRSMRPCFWLFVLLLLAVDMGSVGYKRKQTVMLLMVLSSVIASPRASLTPATLRSRESFERGELRYPARRWWGQEKPG